MIEATLLLFVVVVAALALVLTRVMKPRPDPLKEKARLEQHIAWLEERQAHAALQHWDNEMKQRIDAQLAEARTELAKVAA